MFKQSILLFLGLLALTSASFTPEKNFFMLPYNNGLSNQLFQTRHGIIGYSVDLTQLGQYAPHYIQMNLESANVTEILQDLTTSCGQGPAAFNRLQYHVLTYSFVYYCTNNNSVLILDPQNNFQVQTAFSLSITEKFDEVRLVTDGYSVSILGLSGIYRSSPGPSHLIKVNLQTQQIATHVVFDHGLAAGETVTAYSSNGNMFIVTNTINGTTNVGNLYGMTLIGNSYSLTHLATFNATSSSSLYTLPEFYVIKTLLITSNLDTVMIYDQNGNLQKSIEGVSLNQFPGSSAGATSISRPVMVSYPGSGDVHVLLQNTTLLKVSSFNSGFTISDEGTARSIAIAIQDQLTDSLMFSISGPNQDFRITNIDHGNVVYQSVANFTDFMITDKTYSAINQDVTLLEIFDLQTNTIIQEIPVTNNWFYDQKSSTFSFLAFDAGSNQFKLTQVDLRTGNNYSSLSFSFPPVIVQLLHATNNENFDSPELVLHIGGTDSDEFVIVSQAFGQVKFTVDLPSSSFSSTFAVDYDTLTAFYFQSLYNSQSVSVTEYSYVSSNSSFVSTKTNQYSLNGQLVTIVPATDYSVIEAPGKITVIDMSSLSETDYTFGSQLLYPSTFQNSTNGFNMILTQAQQWGGSPSQAAVILYDNQIQALTGTTGTTVQAAAGGSCSYWVVNQVGSFGYVQFYNICDKDTVSEIFA